MPFEMLYIALLLVIIGVAFVAFKRPIYEAMIITYVIMLLITGNIHNFFTYIWATSTNALFYAIVAFLCVAQVFTSTKVIDICIGAILSVFGRFRGGAALVSLAGSTFMATLTGSGAGNVAATGVFTIPAMKKSGMPAHLAANIEAATSTLGNMIPPSGIIMLSFGALTAYYQSIGQENPYTMSTFWIMLWGIGLWFLLHRFVMTYIFILYYKVTPMPPSEIPKFKDSVQMGWKALLLPLVIFLPFLLDAQFSGFFAQRIAGARGAISGNILQFTPGLAAIYACLIASKGVSVSPKAMAVMFGKSLKSIVPITATIYFAYCLAALFADIGLGPAVSAYFAALDLDFLLLAFLLPLFTAIVGMVIPGSSQVAIFGSAIISIMVAAGGHPLLIAAMLPAITGAMEGMTPPIALCTYTAMGIAQSGFKETVINSLYWIAFHYLLSVICMLGMLPIIGFVY